MISRGLLEWTGCLFCNIIWCCLWLLSPVYPLCLRFDQIWLFLIDHGVAQVLRPLSFQQHEPVTFVTLLLSLLVIEVLFGYHVTLCVTCPWLFCFHVRQPEAQPRLFWCIHNVVKRYCSSTRTWTVRLQKIKSWHIKWRCVFCYFLDNWVWYNTFDYIFGPSRPIFKVLYSWFATETTYIAILSR